MSHLIRTIATALLLLTVAPLSAQAPPAPIPAQLATAKSVFLANAGSTPANNQLAILAYDNLYQGLAAQNRYQLTAAPADADLIFEVSVISVFEGQNATGAQYIQLLIRDAKSQSLLWSTAESIPVAAREKTLEKNAADATAKLVTDLATLTSNHAAAPPPTTTTKKTRFSNQPNN